MSKWITALCVAISVAASFGLGYWFSLARHTVTPDSAWFASNERLRSEILASQTKHNVGQQKTDFLARLAVEPEVPSLLPDAQHLTSDQLSSWIEKLPNHEIDRQLGRLFREDDINGRIHDKRAFAARLVEEALKDFDPNTTLTGRAVISTSQVFPEFFVDDFEVHPRQTLFAHFDTYGKVPHNGQVFIRWRHRDTGRILLFTQKNITADASQNWVSYRPDTVWNTGYYDVKYYQFNDHLEPIAQANYLILRVLDEE